MEGILDSIMSGVEKIVGSDTVKAFSPAIVAAIQSKLLKPPEVKAPKAKAPKDKAPKAKAPKTPAVGSPVFLPAAPRSAGLPKWVLPAALAGAGLLVVGVIMKARGGKGA